MQIYRIKSGDQMPRFSGTAAALGRFDALHRGHMIIIGKAIEYAKRNGLKSLVYMFENEPDEIVSGKCVKSVNTVSRRLEILENAGADIAVVQRFDKGIMNMSRDDFIDKYIKEAFNAKFVAVGFNYRFGKMALGNAEYLCERCREFGAEVFVADGVSDNIGIISSTRIRGLIADGRVDAAAELMGRYFSVEGNIVKGSHIGSDRLGFPTANIVFPQDCAVPGDGVYITAAHIDSAVYPAITNVGGKPTVSESERLIETHICANLGELYDKNICIEFCGFIRRIKKFKSLDELANQLKKDRALSVKFFSDEYKRLGTRGNNK